MLSRDLSTVGRTVEKAAVRCSRVLVSVVPAWPMGKALNSTRIQYFIRVAMRGGVFRPLLVDFNVAAEVHAGADLDDDKGALFSVKRGRVGGGSAWDPSSVHEVRCCARSGVEQHLSLSPWEDPIR